MKEKIITRDNVDIDLNEEVSRYGVFLIGLVSVLFGILGATCLISALVQYGPVEVLKGYLTALTGM